VCSHASRLHFARKLGHNIEAPRVGGSNVSPAILVTHLLEIVVGAPLVLGNQLLARCGVRAGGWSG
jgi:hypothetical protein